MILWDRREDKTSSNRFELFAIALVVSSIRFELVRLSRDSDRSHYYKMMLKVLHCVA